MLTSNQIKNLDKIINEIKNNLDKSENIEETISIYKEAIISFHNLGLFPNHMTIDETQKLMTDTNHKSSKKNIKTGLNENLESDFITNENCQISGETNGTFIFSPFTIGLHNIMWSFWDIIEKLSEIFPWLNEGDFMMVILAISTMIVLKMDQERKKKLFMGSEISLGAVELMSGYPPFPSNGWVNTDGLNGKKNIEGNLYGQISDLTIFILFICVKYFIGVKGFNGIRIEKENNKTFFMGYARKVEIGTEPPISFLGKNHLNVDEIDKNKILNLCNN